MKNRQLKYLLIILLLSLSYPVKAQSQHSIQLDYANTLFSTRQYFDAITEYKRLLFYDDKIISVELIENALGKKIYDLENYFGNDGISFKSIKGDIPLKHMEKIFREKYFRFVRSQSASDAEAAKKLGLAHPNYLRMCKELGLK